MWGFEEVHAGLTVGQIAVLRPKLRICSASDRVPVVRARNRDPVFDYLPVKDAHGHLIGLLSNLAINNASRDGDDVRVSEHMDPLSEADLAWMGKLHGRRLLSARLRGAPSAPDPPRPREPKNAMKRTGADELLPSTGIGEGTPIVVLIGRIRKKPFLVVSALIGLLSNLAINNASRDGDDVRVSEHMDPLSEADLIGEGTPIVVLIGRIRKKPFLVVSAQEVIGLVTWSDLQKLPGRAALFALVTGFELTMYETIKRHFGKSDDWTKLLNGHRLCIAEKQYREQCERGSDVDLLLCTQFCDKRDILIKSFDFDIGKRKLKRKLEAIERVRDDVAHANNYAMSFDQAEQLRATIANLGELRSQINSLAR